MKNLNVDNFRYGYNPERISETLQTLDRAKTRMDECLVAFSGGKDSTVVLDIACRTFSRVEAFFLYFVPGVRIVEDVIDAAEQRWGIKIHRFPHWIVLQCLSTGLFCDPHENIPDDLGQRDVYAEVLKKTGFSQILTGARRQDGPWRRLYFREALQWAEVEYPLIGWSRMDIISYLAARDIPLPPSYGKDGTGIGLHPAGLLWLHDYHRKDYERIRKVFPYVEAVIKRRDCFGIGDPAPVVTPEGDAIDF